ncbi:MAG: hypothetical protein WC906_03195 [Parcubacteria group bacterium]|jgi:hypothetical protein
MLEKFDFSKKEKPPQREVFNEDMTSEPKETAEERERLFAEKFIEENEKQHIPEWEDFLKKVDFPLLKNIFSKLLKQCGIPEEKMNFIVPEKIFSREWEIGAGTYWPEFNVITLSKVIEDKGYNPEIKRLRALIHEEIHAMSKSICIGWSPEKGTFKNQQTGFFRSIYKDAKIQSPVYNDPQKGGTSCEFFAVFNEAVTEKITGELTKEYLTQSNWPRNEIEDYEKEIKEHRHYTYGNIVPLINTIIIKMSLRLKIPRETIWNAIKRSYVEGEKFEDQKIIGLFEETFGKGFLDDFSDLLSPIFAGSEDMIKEFKEKYSLGFLSRRECIEAGLYDKDFQSIYDK